MALILNTEIEQTGIYAEYIRIQSSFLDVDNGKVSMNIEYYADQVARVNGKAPIHRRSIVMPLTGAPLAGTIHQIIYQVLKAHPEFASAVDALE